MQNGVRQREQSKLQNKLRNAYILVVTSSTSNAQTFGFDLFLLFSSMSVAKRHLIFKQHNTMTNSFAENICLHTVRIRLSVSHVPFGRCRKSTIIVWIKYDSPPICCKLNGEREHTETRLGLSAANLFERRINVNSHTFGFGERERKHIIR